MDLNSKLPRTEVVVQVIKQYSATSNDGAYHAADTACLEELGRILAWCLIRDASDQTQQPK